MSRCTFVFRHLLYKDNFGECLHTICWLKCTYSLFNTAVQSLITRHKKTIHTLFIYLPLTWIPIKYNKYTEIWENQNKNYALQTMLQRVYWYTLHKLKLPYLLWLILQCSAALATYTYQIRGFHSQIWT